MVCPKFFLSIFPALASAWDAPSYNGFTKVWQDGFAGTGGSLPDEANWNIINTKMNVNNELETYVRSTRNVQRSGGGTLQLIPWRDSSLNGGWSSGRIESKYIFTPGPGKLTRVESHLRFGPNSIANKAGIWPAFWMLGDSMRHGTPWPACGEIDVMETVNGILTGYGTIHCDAYPGGICNEGLGIGNSIPMQNQDWHTWRVEIDRRKSSWQDETLTWYLDGKQFHQVSGSRVGREDVWTALARRPLFFILNVAVGGNWPGYPTGNTIDGYGSMMEVAYVAHYTT